MSKNEAYTWDQPPVQNVQEDGEFVLLPKGDYDFVVKKFERGRHEGSEKLPACNKAIIHCEITDPKGNAVIKSNLFLHSITQGLLAQFFRSIGLRKSGDDLVLDWARVTGARGRCSVKHREYNGKTYNDLDRFLDPCPSGATPTQTQPTQATSAPATPEAPEDDGLPF